MTELNQIYKCNVCGNIIESVHNGAGELVCCGVSMEQKNETKEDSAGNEKHLPVIEKTSTSVIVRVGEINHPMESEHYIEWIEVITEHRTYRKFLNPDDEPQAEFFLEAENVTARAYCNIHGLWKK
jgi:superoxide reductase